MQWNFLRNLLNNEKVIEHLAESRPIKAAARYTVYLFHKGKQIGYEGLDNLKNKEVKGDSFLGRFKRELQEEVKKMQDPSQKGR